MLLTPGWEYLPFLPCSASPGGQRQDQSQDWVSPMVLVTHGPCHPVTTVALLVAVLVLMGLTVSPPSCLPPPSPRWRGWNEPRDRNSPIFLHGLPELPRARLCLPPAFLSLPIPFPALLPALERGHPRTPCLIHGSCRHTEPAPPARVPRRPGGPGSATSRVAGELCGLLVHSAGKASLEGGCRASPCSPSPVNNPKAAGPEGGNRSCFFFQGSEIFPHWSGRQGFGTGQPGMGLSAPASPVAGRGLRKTPLQADLLPRGRRGQGGAKVRGPRPMCFLLAALMGARGSRGGREAGK